MSAAKSGVIRVPARVRQGCPAIAREAQPGLRQFILTFCAPAAVLLTPPAALHPHRTGPLCPARDDAPPPGRWLSITRRRPICLARWRADQRLTPSTSTPTSGGSSPRPSPGPEPRAPTPVPPICYCPPSAGASLPIVVGSGPAFPMSRPPVPAHHPRYDATQVLRVLRGRDAGRPSGPGRHHHR